MKSPPLAEPSPTLTLLEQKQQAVRSAIFEQATKLLFAQGFHETTIDEIAKAAGIGRRTFFRYFETKEDLVLWKFDQFARHAVHLLEKRPAREASLLAMQRALTEASEFYNQEPARTVAILRMTEATPSLYAQQLLQQERWKDWFAQALRARTRSSTRSLLPETTSAIALETMALAVRRWVAVPGMQLTESISASFASLRKVLGTKVA